MFWIAAKLYLFPKLPDLGPKSVVLPILLLHALRHLGLMFLAPGAVHPGIPQQFTYPAAIGDLLAAILPLIAIPAVVTDSWLARPLVGIFNIVGTLDLVDAILLATINDAAPYMGPAYWIPAFWVPALLVTHYVVFVVLGKRWTADVSRTLTARGRLQGEPWTAPVSSYPFLSMASVIITLETRFQKLSSRREE
jgi:hypothetical protein